jgi:hypothetical protein
LFNINLVGCAYDWWLRSGIAEVEFNVVHTNSSQLEQSKTLNGKMLLRTRVLNGINELI